MFQMLQTVPSATHHSDSYTSYADNFDLSLLPMDLDGDVGVPAHHQLLAKRSPYLSYTDVDEKVLPRALTPELNVRFAAAESESIANDNTANSRPFPGHHFNQYQSELQCFPTTLPLSPQQEPFVTIFPPSPSPSVEYNCGHLPITTIKTEQFVHSGGLYPPSPPDSNGAPSPIHHHCHTDIKAEPYDEIDINTLFANAINNLVATNSMDHHDQLPTKTEAASPSPCPSSHNHIDHSNPIAQPKDHQLLREYLQDTTFQRKHNLKPLALESLFVGDWSARDDIEPVISLALDHARKDVQTTCAALKISPNPQEWTQEEVQKWIQFTIKQYKLSPINNLDRIFSEDGSQLSMLPDAEFINRIPQAGATIHAQLEIWKAACCDAQTEQLQQQQQILFNNADAPQTSNDHQPENIFEPWLSACNSIEETMKVDLDDLDNISMQSPDSSFVCNMPTSSAAAADAAVAAPQGNETNTERPLANQAKTGGTGRQGSAHIHLWQFLKELLASPQNHGNAIRWLDRTKGVFKIEDSVRVARLWGKRKNRPAMNYDKLSRSIRQYYKKGIMKKTERSQRLVYQFCTPYAI